MVFSFSKGVLASCQVLGLVGYGPSHHLQTLNSSSGKLIIIPSSNFLVFLNTSNCTFFLPSFYWYHTTMWLLKLTMELHLLHITNIIPPLRPIILHHSILLGIPHIWRQDSFLFCPKSTSSYIILLSMGQVSSQGTSTLKMHKLIHRPYFSYPWKWANSFFIG